MQQSLPLTWQGSFTFDPADKIYEDHFPGRPVVPGSLIVHAFLKALRHRDGSLRPVHMKKFRFRRFIAPGTYTYTLVRDSGRVQCTLYHQESVVVTGEFIV